MLALSLFNLDTLYKSRLRKRSGKGSVGGGSKNLTSAKKPVSAPAGGKKRKKTRPRTTSLHELFCVGAFSAKPLAGEGWCLSNGCYPQWSHRSAGCTSFLTPLLLSVSRRSSVSKGTEWVRDSQYKHISTLTLFSEKEKKMLLIYKKVNAK